MGFRIKKLEENGFIEYQAGLNLKKTESYIAKIAIQTNFPEKIISSVKKCPLMLIALRLDGLRNVSIIVISSEMKTIEMIVNTYFRDNPDVINLSINFITGLSEDLILPIDLNLKECNCILKNNCKFSCENSFN